MPPFGNVSLLHITDMHAQLLPVHFREPSVNLGDGKPPHLVGEHAAEALRHAARQPRARTPSRTSTSRPLARRYGKVGGFAHLATLVKRLRAARPQRAAARRRRHLAGLGDRAVDARRRT